MNGQQLKIIRLANRELQEFVDLVAHYREKGVEARGAAVRLDRVNLRLRQVSTYFGQDFNACTQTPETAYEVMKYRDILKNLRSTVESLESSLVTEKTRLQSVRANLKSACAWATSLREIS